jgi:hypothetical protein
VTELRTQGDPIAVKSSAVTDALERLGIHDWNDDVIDVLIERRRITVKRIRRDEQGHPVAAADEVATTTTVIAIRRDES